MRRFTGMLAGVAIFAVLGISTARAADVEQPILLVASTRLEGTPFEQTVIVAAPVSNGGHMGFIINRRTTVKLDALFPDDSAARNVTDPVYLGGPALPQGLFALTQHVPEGTDSSIPLMPGVYAVLDAASVDHLIETTPNAARYFVGMMVWEPDELEEQIKSGLWEAHLADPQMVLPARPTGLWNALRRPMALMNNQPASRLG